MYEEGHEGEIVSWFEDLDFDEWISPYSKLSSGGQHRNAEVFCDVILAKAMKVHFSLGENHMEETYVNALAVELLQRPKIKYLRESNHDIWYGGSVVGTARMDLILFVDSHTKLAEVPIVLEAKTTTTKTNRDHRSQLKRYIQTLMEDQGRGIFGVNYEKKEGSFDVTEWILEHYGILVHFRKSDSEKGVPPVTVELFSYQLIPPYETQGQAASLTEEYAAAWDGSFEGYLEIKERLKLASSSRVRGV